MNNVNSNKPQLHLTVMKVIPPDPIDWARRRQELADRQSARTVVAPPPGARLKNFDDRSVIEAVKTAMKEHPKDTESAAKSIGIDVKVYRLIMKLLTLQEGHIPHHHRETIDRALKLIEQTKRAAKARALTSGLIKELWQKKDDGKSWKREKRFSQTLISISESCETTKDMEIPRDLSPAAAREATATLAGSMELIARLMRRLLGEEIDHE